MSGEQGKGKGRGIAEDTQGKFLDRELAARLWVYIRPHKFLLFLSLGLMPVAIGLDILQPIFIQLAFDRGISAADEGALGFYLLLFLFSLFGGFAATFIQNATMILAGLRSTNDLRNAAFRHLLSLKQSYFDRQLVGRLLTRVTSDVDALNEAFAAGLFSLVADFLALIGIAVILIIKDWKLALVTFLSAPVLLASGALMRGVTRTAFRDIRARTASINAFLKEHVSGMPIVQAFRQEDRVARKFDEDNLAYLDAARRFFFYDAFLFAWVEALSTIFTGFIVWVAVGRIEGGVVTFGVLVAFLKYLERFFAPLRDLATKFTVMQSAFAAAEKLVGLLQEKEILPEPAGKEGFRATFEREISFENVSFSYGGDEATISNVSFSLPRGKKVAIVGATGAGKSTLVRLLMRQHDVDKGRILMDGVDIRDIPKKEYKRRFAVVLQDVFLFSGTVAENLSLFDDSLPRARLEEAARAVQADELIRKLPGGYDAKVLERGGNFSQGERQLLAFARALAQDPEILVLDEATASVDSVTEARLQKALDVLFEGRTALVVAHRLSTIRRCDEILVMHKGRLAERGSHEELLAKKGLYARLYRLQFAAEERAA